MNEPLDYQDQVFISYSHQDKQFFDDLVEQLTPRIVADAITAWSDEKIAPGSKWFAEIQVALARASVGVMLVSPGFLASEFIREHELGPLLAKAEVGGVKIVWVMIRDCAWKATPLKHYQATVSPPDPPLASMARARRDTAWRKVCEAIEEAWSNPQPASPDPDGNAPMDRSVTAPPDPERPRPPPAGVTLPKGSSTPQDQSSVTPPSRDCKAERNPIVGYLKYAAAALVIAMIGADILAYTVFTTEAWEQLWNRCGGKWPSGTGLGLEVVRDFLFATITFSLMGFKFLDETVSLLDIRKRHSMLLWFVRIVYLGVCGILIPVQINHVLSTRPGNGPAIVAQRARLEHGIDTTAEREVIQNYIYIAKPFIDHIIIASFCLFAVPLYAMVAEIGCLKNIYVNYNGQIAEIENSVHVSSDKRKIIEQSFYSIRATVEERPNRYLYLVALMAGAFLFHHVLGSFVFTKRAILYMSWSWAIVGLTALVSVSPISVAYSACYGLASNAMLGAGIWTPKWARENDFSAFCWRLIRSNIAGFMLMLMLILFTLIF